MNKIAQSTLIAIAALMFAGCSSAPKKQEPLKESRSDPLEEGRGDPLEGFNRTMFTFNDKLDQYALKPTATVYQSYVPSFVKMGVGNFFGNIGDVWTMANSFMQLKVGDGLEGFMRVAVNSTFGIGGLLDVSGEAGIPKRNEDFGQTLGYWGVPSGPYLVLPLLGPSTIRDTAGLPVDATGNLWTYINPETARLAGTVVRVVDRRAAYLGATNLMEEVALDKYQFVRDSFLQSREAQVNDRSNRDGDDPENMQEGPGLGRFLRQWIPIGR